MAKKKGTRLRVHDFGPIQDADITFGDLTVLVGPQATGKSLLLQSLKLGIDFGAIRATFERNGVPWPKRPQWDDFLEQYYGEGMHGLWKEATSTISVGTQQIDSSILAKRNGGSEAIRKVLYVPAQRALIVPDGFPRAFRDLGADTPFAVREFSDGLHRMLTASSMETLFPASGKLDDGFRKQLDRAIFNGGSLSMETTGRRRYELTLTIDGKHRLPSIAWTAGQREFVPLLLSLYPALTGGKVPKDPSLDWIIIEEPEMGLHPQAIVTTMFLILELIQRGYKVVLSTHHPVVVDVLWAIQTLRTVDPEVSTKMLLKAMGMPSTPKSKKISANALQSDVRVYALDHAPGQRTTVTDISDLDPSAEASLEQGWGGLTAYSSAISEAVAEAVANA